MKHYQDFQERKSRNKKFLGILIIVIGIIALLKQVFLFPIWHFRDAWPFLLIAIGIFIGIKNRFQTIAPYILIGIGLFHLIPNFSFFVGDRIVYSRHLAVPMALIGIGAIFMLNQRKKKSFPHTFTTNTASEDLLNVDITFSGRKEFVTSKNFQGGNINAAFGGAEINLMQADSPSDLIILNVRVNFGGVDMTVPANWIVKNEIETTFGSVEDQRKLQSGAFVENQKTLVLRGSCNFGGVEIKSF